MVVLFTRAKLSLLRVVHWRKLKLVMFCACQVHSVAWSCDGRRLASGSFDRTVSIFVLEKDRLVSTVSMSLFTIFRFLDLNPSF